MHKIGIMKYLTKTYICLILLILTGQISSAETFDANYKTWSVLPARALYDKGISFLQHKNKPDSALVCFTLLASRYPNYVKDDSERRICIAAMNTAGQIYMDYYHNLNKAYQLFLQSQDYSREKGFDDISSFNFLCLANLSYLKNSMALKGYDYKNVTGNYRKAFWAAVRAKAPNAIVPSLINMVYMSFAKGNVKEAMQEINQFMKLKLPGKTTSLEFARNLCIAMKAWIEKDGRHALEYIENMRKTIDQRQSDRRQSSLLMIYYETKYNYFRLSGQPEKALHTLKAYEAAADSLHSDNDMLDIYRYCYLYNTSRGNFQQASLYELGFYRLKDKIINETGMPTLEQTRFLYELGRIQKQAEEDKMAKKIHRTILISLSVILLLLLVVLYQIYKKYKAEKENNRILYESNLKMLASEQQSEKLMQYLPDEKATQEESRQKYVNSSMSEDEKDGLFDRIRRFMATSKEIYSEQFSLPRLSELLNEKENNISQTIGEKYQGNFYSLLCEYRIREACRMFNDQQYSSYTIEAIAQSVGYKSRTNFTKNFKAVTGMTPSAYQKMAIKRLSQ